MDIAVKPVFQWRRNVVHKALIERTIENEKRKMPDMVMSAALTSQGTSLSKYAQRRYQKAQNPDYQQRLLAEEKATPTVKRVNGHRQCKNLQRNAGEQKNILA